MRNSHSIGRCPGKQTWERLEYGIIDVGSRTDSETCGTSSIGEIMLEELDEVDCSVGEYGRTLLNRNH